MNINDISVISKGGINTMREAINDKRVIGNMIIDTLIRIKDRHRDVLTRTEVDDLNRAANFIEDVIREIKE